MYAMTAIMGAVFERQFFLLSLQLERASVFVCLVIGS